MGDPIMQLPGPDAPQPVQINEGGNSTLGAINAVLQGLQQGHAKRVGQQWSDLQRSYMGAKVAADAIKSHIAALPPGSPELEHAQQQLQQATQNLADNAKALTEFAQGGGKSGGKGGKSKDGAAGAGQSILGKALNLLMGGHSANVPHDNVSPVTPAAKPVPPAPTGMAAPAYSIPNSAENLTA